MMTKSYAKQLPASTRSALRELNRQLAADIEAGRLEKRIATSLYFATGVGGGAVGAQQRAA